MQYPIITEQFGSNYFSVLIFLNVCVLYVCLYVHINICVCLYICIHIYKFSGQIETNDLAHIPCPSVTEPTCQVFPLPYWSWLFVRFLSGVAASVLFWCLPLPPCSSTSQRCCLPFLPLVSKELVCRFGKQQPAGFSSRAVSDRMMRAHSWVWNSHFAKANL